MVGQRREKSRAFQNNNFLSREQKMNWTELARRTEDGGEENHSHFIAESYAHTKK
jgi:hypothetical protein